MWLFITTRRRCLITYCIVGICVTFMIRFVSTLNHIFSFSNEKKPNWIQVASTTYVMILSTFCNFKIQPKSLNKTQVNQYRKAWNWIWIFCHLQMGPGGSVGRALGWYTGGRRIEPHPATKVHSDAGPEPG